MSSEALVRDTLYFFAIGRLWDLILVSDHL